MLISNGWRVSDLPVSMINIGILEDEADASDLLAGFIKRYGQEKRIDFNLECFTTAEDLLRSYKPRFDILFLDVELPGQNGFEAAKAVRKLDPKVIIIFVTNMAQFAVNGYEVDALDFIVKPINYDSFSMRMAKAVEKALQSQECSLSISADRKLVVLKISEIDYVEVRDHDLVFHLGDKEYRSRGSLSSIEEALSKKNFARASNYSLANLANVVEVDHDEVHFAKGMVRLSRLKKKDFLSSLANYLGRN